MTEPIPGPPGLPIIGNVNDIDPIDSIKSLNRLADIYGPIFKLHLGGTDRLYISSQALLNEVCDEKRFTKIVAGALNEIRNGVQDGLFTAHPGEHNWEVAHRVLMPAFGPLSIRNMFDEMHDIASQLVVKWARFGPKEKIDVTGDFTRLTLDSIALCAMDLRFNSFYHEEMHPFVNAMTGFLQESGARANRPHFLNYFMRSTQQKYDSDIALLKQVAIEAVAERKAHPSKKNDLLNAMLNGRDPKTGEGLTDESILNNMITFLIAGHETTSGMLSFLFYQLLKNPSTYQKAQKQVDEVVGRGPVTIEHMSKLPYIEACLRETLRLTPTAPVFSMQPRPDTTEDPITIGGGKYEIAKGQPIMALLSKVHKDPLVYGEDAEEFRPERMLDEPFSKLPPNAWKPFGNGMRGCIGRPFAWQESTLTVALLLQNFNFRFDDPSYVLGIKQTLTIKPKDFYMHATLRDHIDPVHLERSLHVSMPKEEDQDKKQKLEGLATNGAPKRPMTILYGSNAGTCEALAQSLARVASGRGYKVDVDPLDVAVDRLPKDQPVIMITASYEGQPPDNAAHFVEWLESLGGGTRLEGVKYAVFGCGNHDWVNTFHRIPKLIDAAFEKNGASRIVEAGLVDVAADDVFNDFDSWQDDHLWSKLGGDSDVIEDTSLEIEVDTDSRRSTLRQDVKEAVVLGNERLTAEGVPEKRYVALKLPTGMSYKVGDYLAILPVNPSKTTRRVLKRYGLPWDAMITIKPGANTTLPTGHPLSAMDVLGAYVELTQPATKKNVAKIAASISDPSARAEVEALAGPQFETEVSEMRLSPLDLLEKFPEAALPLADFLAMLPPMRIRQYSISSSPLADPTIATLTCSVLDAPHNGKHEKRFLGVASNYLASVEEHDRIHVAVKPSHGAFHPPTDVENTPLIMLCAGAGLAPFRGFMEERAKQIEAGRKLAPAYLFIGCKHPEKDRLFQAELDQWERDGVMKLFYAFSKATELSKGCRYVQDRLWEEREEMVKVFNSGAKLYVCGTAGVGEGVTKTTKKIYQEAAEAMGKPKTDEEVDEWFNAIKGERFASDVFN
ncbi:bifunctional cytochrome P450 reductase [Coleophoma crateriformis]|uniref:Bifunctional cytochrome P450/NADPH--P450 reductase n=1 Tax=Coleophoma crateriformis TaxID=565419 RepID=A0A3D8SHZ2_9HELO|nr:bifunctional cytochrome P450 reductase [Coleophoma crateriformis]